ncbi:2-oxoglutarate dehydrogenase E1 component [Exiguobacterium aurantiacum]|uniref:2-oxoglutarate dehydrogenase E1 component n=1 Tax=Exiguobacterium aurantiacum TaxID=33987 RepID=A0ABY5FKU2_9BACL|nr:2-oxoglutarate dehydrogenase E1 component [Exiguobacterium aurantiacum]UTT42157.1 2-oxoglutarate dehydrogenase E1 component [Exiguobacterium aurantiacum]
MGESSNGREAVQAFYGPNLGYIVELYEQYVEDPESVDEETRQYFDEYGAPETSAPVAPAASFDLEKVVAATRLVNDIRALGHKAADIYPLKDHPREHGLFAFDRYGLSEADLEQVPAHLLSEDVPKPGANALELVRHLLDVYTGPVAIELRHLDDMEEKRWIRRRIEQGALQTKYSKNEKIELFERLAETELFESFLHKTYVGQKRFSIEGLDAMVPLLDAMVGGLISSGSEHINIGMAHRGRLNVLAHVLGKPYEMIFAEFQHAPNKELIPSEGSIGINFGWSGDVKYHLGLDRRVLDEKKEVRLNLANNPSHLEFVGSVVEGYTRAAQDDRSEKGMAVQHDDKAASILIHGDAAFPGQGIVAETLNMTNLQGYRTAGTVHVIANNTIGFTTDPSDSRSTRYASDIAKGYEIPVFHVNADDPEACVAVAKLCSEYRAKFHKDILVDLVGYRRYGHNEMDEPMNTNPVLYKAIKEHKSVRHVYADVLEAEGVMSKEDKATIEQSIEDRLKSARDLVPAEEEDADIILPEAVHKGFPFVETGVERDVLQQLNDELLVWPEGFGVFHKLQKVLDRRRDAFADNGKVDWGHAETLAYASIISDGTPIRLSGQDSERGTFAQRNIMLNDVETGKKFSPLHHLSTANASFSVHNSPLSEGSVLGFEYGYNVFAQDTLVLWEAQYGDFANSAQVMFDQFISAGRAKWGQKSGLVMLLPHGYEGQGPEHSSARMERYLTLAGEKNWTVANLSTAAQYFHILRRQAKMLGTEQVRPMIIMTPKSLLRHPLAASSVDELSDNSFRPIIEQTGLGENSEKVERLVFCSGKMAIDLQEATMKSEESLDFLHIIRVEEIYPFPVREIRELISRYPNAKEIVWVQEEPKNMGAWTYIEPRLEAVTSNRLNVRYVGRRRRSSPAEGNPTAHKQEQARIIREAISRDAVSAAAGTSTYQKDRK